MTVSLDVSRAKDVAVLHGVDSEPALTHLARSLVTGSVFDCYRALVVDLGGVALGPAAARALAAANDACFARQQYLGLATDRTAVGGAIGQARKWLRLVDQERRLGAAAAVVGMHVVSWTAPLRTVIGTRLWFPR